MSRGGSQGRSAVSEIILGVSGHQWPARRLSNVVAGFFNTLANVQNLVSVAGIGSIGFLFVMLAGGSSKPEVQQPTQIHISIFGGLPASGEDAATERNNKPVSETAAVPAPLPDKGETAANTSGEIAKPPEETPTAIVEPTPQLAKAPPPPEPTASDNIAEAPDERPLAIVKLEPKPALATPPPEPADEAPALAKRGGIVSERLGRTFGGL